MLKFIKIVWIIICILVLFTSFYYFDDDPKNDIDIFLIWSMLVLSFPSGYVVAGIFTSIAILLVEFEDITLSTSYFLIFINWLAYFIAGYFQWFVWVPKLIKWGKDKMGKRATH